MALFKKGKKGTTGTKGGKKGKKAGGNQQYMDQEGEGYD